MRAVRFLLAFLACSVLGTYRPLTGPPKLGSLAVVLGIVLASVIAINFVARRVPNTVLWNIVMQTIDVIAIVGLAVALDDPLGQQSWALLVVPVVSAAVRFGSLPALLSWVVGCGLYIGAASIGLVNFTDEASLFARVPGVLLAVAITVGLLARWMREGWEIQNELTETVAAREGRLAVIEQTSYDLKDLEPRRALELCANRVVALGFEAATVDDVNGPEPLYAVGDCTVLARTAGLEDDIGAVAIVTAWVDGDEVRAHSVAMREPRSASIVTGWSAAPINADLVEAFATLVAHTSSAIEATTLLRGLRYSAAHDELTGLANRRTLSIELSRLAVDEGLVSVLFVDLDDFKSINDTYGHAVGDNILVALSRRLETVVQDHGMIARYGGDEFVVLLPGADRDMATRLAETELLSCGTSIVLGVESFDLGLSIGIATARTPAAAAELLRGADRAVYIAKDRGKGTVFAADLDHLDDKTKILMDRAVSR